MLCIDKVLRPMISIVASLYLKQLVHGVSQLGLDMLQSGLCVLQLGFVLLLYHPFVRCILNQVRLPGSMFPVCSFAWNCLQPLFGAFQRLMPWRRSPTRVVDSEAQPPDENLDVVPTSKCLAELELLDTPTSSLEAPRIMWLLETSIVPEVSRRC